MTRVNKKIPVSIQEDYVEGTETLQREVPWQVPESIHKEDENLFSDDFVLEIGSGGSTLFFARRCGKVVSVETSPEFFKEVEKKIADGGITNIHYHLVPGGNDIFAFIRSMDIRKVTVFSVDTQGGGYNRSEILEEFLSKGVQPALRMIVLDNYSHPELFPDHHDKILDLGEGWEVFTYNHPRWAGDGTRLYIKKD